jgi:hypothetical protein
VSLARALSRPRLRTSRARSDVRPSRGSRQQAARFEPLARDQGRAASKKRGEASSEARARGEDADDAPPSAMADLAKANEPVPDMVKQFVVYFYRHIREKNGTPRPRRSRF